MERQLFIAVGRNSFAVGCRITSPNKAILTFQTLNEARDFIWDYEAESIKI